MVFALPPQTKGRVERTAGTLSGQVGDRAQTRGCNHHQGGQRRAGGTSLTASTDALECRHSTLEQDVCFDTVLCFRHSRRVARDNTVKHKWRTLQLLPGMERPSYAGVVAFVLEGLDGQLAVRHGDRIIASQEEQPARTSRQASRARPHTGHSNIVVSTVWAGTGRRPRQHSTLGRMPAMPTTTALSEFVRPLPCQVGHKVPRLLPETGGGGGYPPSHRWDRTPSDAPTCRSPRGLYRSDSACEATLSRVGHPG